MIVAFTFMSPQVIYPFLLLVSSSIEWGREEEKVEGARGGVGRRRRKRRKRRKIKRNLGEYV